jgi:hypothetical protein
LTWQEEHFIERPTRAAMTDQNTLISRLRSCPVIAGKQQGVRGEHIPGISHAVIALLGCDDVLRRHQGDLSRPLACRNQNSNRNRQVGLAFDCILP